MIIKEIFDAIDSIEIHANGMKVGSYWYPIIGLGSLPTELRAELERRIRIGNRERVDACAEYCKGFSNEVLARGSLRGLVARKGEIEGERDAMKDALNTLLAAARVVQLTPQIREYLAVNDPKALEQLERAIASARELGS